MFANAQTSSCFVTSLFCITLDIIFISSPSLLSNRWWAEAEEISSFKFSLIFYWDSDPIF